MNVTYEALFWLKAFKTILSSISLVDTNGADFIIKICVCYQWLITVNTVKKLVNAFVCIFIKTESSI